VDGDSGIAIRGVGQRPERGEKAGMVARVGMTPMRTHPTAPTWRPDERGPG